MMHGPINIRFTWLWIFLNIKNTFLNTGRAQQTWHLRPPPLCLTVSKTLRFTQKSAVSIKFVFHLSLELQFETFSLPVSSYLGIYVRDLRRIARPVFLRDFKQNWRESTHFTIMTILWATKRRNRGLIPRKAKGFSQLWNPHGLFFIR